jgi:hypothetical protein
MGVRLTKLFAAARSMIVNIYVEELFGPFKRVKGLQVGDPYERTLLSQSKHPPVNCGVVQYKLVP